MRKYFLPVSGMAALALLLSHSAMAQDKEKNEDKNKLGEYDEIVIKKKTDKNGNDVKLNIEVNKDGEITVNGKPIDDYDNEMLSVRKHSVPRYGDLSPFRSQNWNSGGNSFGYSSNKPLLGVSTEKADGGAKVNRVAEGSAAEKAGIKEGDVINRVDDKKIENSEDLVSAISHHKPNDKVTITYKRNGKDQTATITLGKRAPEAFSFSGPEGLMPPHIEAIPDMRNFHFEMPDGDGNLFFHSGKPRLGIKAQDTEDGKGVKVLSVDDESNAEKAGIKEGDIITEFDGKAVNSAEELAQAADNAKAKSSVQVKLLHDGKSRTVDIKVPKKLKTANL